jgi:predicted cupin superfamily sugar epimerase
MEDTGTMQALTNLAKARRVDLNRVLVLRTASNFDSPRLLYPVAAGDCIWMGLFVPSGLSPWVNPRHGISILQGREPSSDLTGAQIHRDYGDKSMNATSESPAQKLIRHFKMEKIPAEGPWFSVTYRSEDLLPAKSLPVRYQGNRVAGTAIYAIQTKADFSAIHKLTTDEIWHFYGGDPLEMLLLYPDGHGQIVVLGADVFSGQYPQFVVPRDVWQGSRPMGAEPESYAFFGNTLAPGFEFDDFEMGYRDELQEKYPEFAGRIARLTRTEFIARR